MRLSRGPGGPQHPPPDEVVPPSVEPVRYAPDRLLLLVVAVLVGVFLALPRAAAGVVFVAVSGGCLCAYILGVRRNQPSAPLVWRVLGGAMALLFAGDIGHHTGLYTSDVPFTLAYLLATMAAVLLLRARGSGADREGLLDAAVVTVGAATLLWQVGIAPNLPGSGDAPPVNVLLYPLFDVLIFGLLVRLWFSPGVRSRSLRYFVLALCAALAGDLAVTVLHAAPELPWVEATSLLTRAFLAAAVLHRGVRALPLPARAPAASPHPPRLIAVSVTVITLALLGGVHELRSGDLASLGLGAGPALVAGLVIGRLAMAVRRHEAARRSLEHHALHDSLTGLPDRRLLADRISVALTRAEDGPPVTVLAVNLDDFKTVNDALGHGAGDEALSQVAVRLRRVLAPSETVARLGGDEFVVCSDRLATEEAALSTARSILEVLAAPFTVNGGELRLGAGIGIARSSPGATAESLLQDADAAMYAAKSLGRRRVELFNPRLGEAAAEQRELQRELVRAVGGGELRLHLQPILDVRTHRTVALEALVRWQHPRRGLVGPGAFIPLAESGERILPLGAWVLDEACRCAAAWSATSHDPPAVAVNVSARQLDDPGFAALVRATLRRRALDPGLLCLEITETELVTDRERAVRVLTALKELGVRLAIDDFGNGYSSLGYLKWLPVDQLKIDRSLVAGVAVNAQDRAIVVAAITLGHSLGLEVIAEGVETPRQLDALAQLGCDQVQGFHLGRPAAQPQATAPVLRQGSGMGEGEAYEPVLAAGHLRRDGGHHGLLG